MLVILYIFGILLGFIRERFKVVRIYQFIILWILFAFNTLNADMDTYKIIYQGYYGDDYEIGFVLWRHLFSDRGISFEAFWIVSMTIVLLLIFRALRKLFDEIHNGAMSVMMIFPLPIMVITLRNTMSIAIILTAFVWYLKCDSTRISNKIKYTLLILLAATFHYGALFFLVLLVIKEELPSIKSLIRAITIIIIAMIGLNTSAFRVVLNRLFHTRKVLSWFDSSNRIGLGIILVVGLHVIGFAIATYSNKCQNYSTVIENESCRLIEKKIYSLNVYSMFLLGFYTFNMEFFSRIYCTVIMVNTVNNFHLLRNYKKNKYTVYGIIMQMMYIVLVLSLLYFRENFKIIRELFINNSLL